MRFFDLLNLQHVAAYIFLTLLFIVLFGLGLAYSHLHSEDAERRKTEIVGSYLGGIKDRDAPYPLVMTLIIAGAVIWGVFYIMIHGMLGVKI